MDYNHILDNLPTEKTNEDRAKRLKMFSGFDPNGNGYLSLAETDRGITVVLNMDSVFNCKPAIFQAFKHAKDCVNTKSKHGDDYIEKIEFRYFLLFLKQYFMYYQMFDEVDTNDDRRVTLTEFKQAQSLMESFGLVIDDYQAEFNKIDTNGGGMILFDEFAAYCIKKTLTAEEDCE